MLTLDHWTPEDAPGIAEAVDGAHRARQSLRRHRLVVLQGYTCHSSARVHMPQRTRIGRTEVWVR